MLSITILKSDLKGNISCEFSDFFKIARRASLEESPCSKVIGEIYKLYTSVKNFQFIFIVDKTVDK